MKKIETVKSNTKSQYDKINAEVINIENMNLEFDIEIDEYSCTKDCPYREFYMKTMGKKKDLPNLIEKRNQIIKEMNKSEELYNLYTTLCFIKEHIFETAFVKSHQNDFDVYLQGSYANSTNIKRDSDVDIVLQYNGVI